MIAIGNDLSGYLIVLAIAMIMHESWRWLGAVLGARIRENDDVFVWVRYVSTAIVSALTMRIILFPAGALATVDLPYRLAALAIATTAFLLFRRNLAIGIVAGSVSLIVMALAFSGA